MNFGNQNVASFPSNIPSDPGAIQYGNVATFDPLGLNIPINATITKDATYLGVNGGSQVNDLFFQVNGNDPDGVILTLRLWNAAAGTGYDTPFNPGIAYTYSLVFYDVDGPSTDTESVTVYTAGTYEVATTSSFNITNLSGGAVRFVEQGPEVAGFAGITNAQFQANPAFQNAAIRYTVANTNEMVFGLQTGVGSDRVYRVDGGELQFSLPTFIGPVGITPIPEPSTVLLGAFASLLLLRRRRTAL